MEERGIDLRGPVSLLPASQQMVMHGFVNANYESLIRSKVIEMIVLLSKNLWGHNSEI